MHDGLVLVPESISRHRGDTGPWFHAPDTPRPSTSTDNLHKLDNQAYVWRVVGYG